MSILTKTLFGSSLLASLAALGWLLFFSTGSPTSADAVAAESTSAETAEAATPPTPIQIVINLVGEPPSATAPPGSEAAPAPAPAPGPVTDPVVAVPTPVAPTIAAPVPARSTTVVVGAPRVTTYATTYTTTYVTTIGPTTTTQNQFVVASDGSIVFLGDNGVLNANTGAASASGIIDVGGSGSTFTSGESGLGAASPARIGVSVGPAGAIGVGASGTSTIVGTGAFPTFSASITASLADRPVSFSGYEDESVNVLGNRQIVATDDSNIFINRDGPINANTGDTDSSGLNAVDVRNSTVRSGPSSDDEEDAEEAEDAEDSEDSDEEGEEAEEEEELRAAVGSAIPTTEPVVSPWPTFAGTTGAETAVSGDEDAAATGTDPLVVGGDGYVDLAIRSVGDDNVIIRDDSNIVIGGTGPVNAQIGDSDTGGTVVMGIDNSIIEGGASN